MPAGTYVAYTFDEAVPLGQTAGLFKVYNGDSTVAGSGAIASLQPGGTTVVVIFTGLTSAASAASLSVATVVQGAVIDATGNINPEGDAAIGGGSSTTLTAGVTAAPDLVSVGGYRQAAAIGSTAVDFTFDEPATVQGATGFYLVPQDASLPLVGCTSSTTPAASAPSGGTVPGGSGTTVITVVCDNLNLATNPPGGTPLSQVNIARGAVVFDAVEDTSASTWPNPLETADSGNSGNTSGPDLVSAVLVQGTSADYVLYVFDSNLTAAAGGFIAYDNTGAEIPQSGPAAISGTNPKQVLVPFGGPTALDSVVGVAAYPGAVSDSTGPNWFDEVATSNSNSTTIVPGQTTAPDLIGVALAATNGFVPAVATYTFDQNVDTASITDGLFHLYTATGVELTALSCVRGTDFASGDSATASPSVSCIFTASTTADRDEYQRHQLGSRDRRAGSRWRRHHPGSGQPRRRRVHHGWHGYSVRLKPALP